MARRKARRREPEFSRYAVTVAAASARVGRTGPGILNLSPQGEAETTISVEGRLEPPVIRMETASILVFCRDGDEGDPGSAIGGTTIWHVVLDLPRRQFSDLLAMVLADKLVKVDLLFGPVRRGKGTLRSVSFRTAPVPSEAEDEGG